MAVNTLIGTLKVNYSNAAEVRGTFCRALPDGRAGHLTWAAWKRQQ